MTSATRSGGQPQGPPEALVRLEGWAEREQWIFLRHQCPDGLRGRLRFTRRGRRCSRWHLPPAGRMGPGLSLLRPPRQHHFPGRESIENRQRHPARVPARRDRRGQPRIRCLPTAIISGHISRCWPGSSYLPGGESASRSVCWISRLPGRDVLPDHRARIPEPQLHPQPHAGDYRDRFAGRRRQGHDR